MGLIDNYNVTKLFLDRYCEAFGIPNGIPNRLSNPGSKSGNKSGSKGEVKSRVKLPGFYS